MKIDLDKIPEHIDINTGVISYRFWIDQCRKRVSGNAVAHFKEGMRRESARVKQSQADNWDPIIGVALCKLKIDNKLGILEVDGKHRGWPKLKDFMCSPTTIRMLKKFKDEGWIPKKDHWNNNGTPREDENDAINKKKAMYIHG